MKINKTIKSLSFASLLALTLTMMSCSGSGPNEEWRMKFYPAVGTSYSTLSVYSAVTGQYDNYYIEEGKWTKNETIPSPDITINKGDLRMDYLPATASTLPGLSIYCATTGQYEQMYLENGEWIKNPHIPMPKPTIKGGGIRMEYMQGNASVLPTLNVYSTVTKEFEQLYLTDGEWLRNPNFPAENKI